MTGSVNSQLDDQSDQCTSLLLAFCGCNFLANTWAHKIDVKFASTGQRRVDCLPGCLDVRFLGFESNQVARAAVDEMDSSGSSHNSKSAAGVVDDMHEGMLGNSVYSSWLKLLSTLSRPTTSPTFPQAMRTRAWAAKDMETQAASWTELRHDSVSQASNASPVMMNCDYPAGFVDPRPEFWHAFLEMVSLCKDIIHNSLVSERSLYTRFLSGWKETLLTLEAIARKERAGKPLSICEGAFLKAIVSDNCRGSEYSGWYCKLFYGSEEDSCKADYIVTGAHTDPADGANEGTVLDEAIGQPAMMTIAIDSGCNLRVYIGPVFSHYELQRMGNECMSDNEWAAMVLSGDVPKQPDWKVHRADGC